MFLSFLLSLTVLFLFWNRGLYPIQRDLAVGILSLVSLVGTTRSSPHQRRPLVWHHVHLCRLQWVRFLFILSMWELFLFYFYFYFIAFVTLHNLYFYVFCCCDWFLLLNFAQSFVLAAAPIFFKKKTVAIEFCLTPPSLKISIPDILDPSQWCSVPLTWLRTTRNLEVFFFLKHPPSFLFYIFYLYLPCISTLYLLLHLLFVSGIYICYHFSSSTIYFFFIMIGHADID